jgi:PAS domain S-box-containing protein
MNLNKIFPFLSIRTKLIVAFSMLSFIPLAIIGTYATYNIVSSMHKKALENLHHDLELVSEKTQNFFSEIGLDIIFLTKSPLFQEFINSNPNQQNPDEPNIIVQLENQLLAFAKIKRQFYQIRFISAEGNEILRIRYTGEDYIITSSEDMSDSHFNFYFVVTENIENDQIALTPVELFTPDHETIPAISFAKRVRGSNEKFAGIFVADIYARHLFELLEKEIHTNFKRNLAIVNNEGAYLYHSEKKRNWNRLLASRKENNLLNDYPDDYTKAILSGDEGIVYSEHEDIIAYMPLFTTFFSGGHSYYIFESVKESNIFGPVHSYAAFFIGFMVFFLLISVFLGYLATTQIAGPVRQLQDGAETIAAGNYNHRINIETNDEIEQLAIQFNNMAGALHKREKLLEQNKAQLEKKVLSRTKELVNEKEKLQAVLDNVPSAFLLLDSDCKILSASAAIEKIASVNPVDILGQKCYRVFEDNAYCKNCQKSSGREVNEIRTSIERRLDKSGKNVYIEHITIPLKSKNRLYASLEILTDITERKLIEQQLIKTEKMVATGEMSAIIAHEIRNSLTSVKMILQLQIKNSKNEDEQKSLQVAIDSIYRMEEVINNLLRFSRPVPLKFSLANINDIIESSIVFVQPQLGRKKIRFTKELDGNLPKVKVDSNQIRDVLINMILNSIQAVGGNGEIDVVSGKVRLDKNIEDPLYPPFNSNNQAKKIVFNKGQQVIRINISDNGQGIDKEKVKNIFDPYFTTKLNGTGLGLTIAKRTINDHGGIIELKKFSKGKTMFTIMLPAGDYV